MIDIDRTRERLELLAIVAKLEQRLERVVSILEPFHDPDDPEDISAGATAIRAARGQV